MLRIAWIISFLLSEVGRVSDYNFSFSVLISGRPLGLGLGLSLSLSHCFVAVFGGDETDGGLLCE